MFTHERDDNLDWISETVCPLAICIILECETLPGRGPDNQYEWGSSKFGFLHIPLVEMVQSGFYREVLPDMPPSLLGSAAEATRTIAYVLREGVPRKSAQKKSFWEKVFSFFADQYDLYESPPLFSNKTFSGVTGYMCQSMRFFPAGFRDFDEGRPYIPCVFIQMQQKSKAGDPEELLVKLKSKTCAFLQQIGIKTCSWSGAIDGRARAYASFFEHERNSAVKVLIENDVLDTGKRKGRKRI